MEIGKREFNEVFLSEISKFDSGNYAYDIFFNCDKERFSKIATNYGKRGKYGSLNYMYENFYSWKNGTVNPNINTRTKIVCSTIETFTVEEKFIEAYSKLAKHINEKFYEEVNLKDLGRKFASIIDVIEKFELKDCYRRSHIVFKTEEIEDYQNYVKNVFVFYTKTIFNNLIKDIPLILWASQNINSSFLSFTFRTYLFNIKINVQEVSKKNYNYKKVLEELFKLEYEQLLNSKLFDFSISKILEITKANNITKIDALLTENQIEKIIEQKNQIEQSKQSGIIKYILKTNGGILTIDLKILSPLEKLIICLRVLAYISTIAGLIYYCFIITQSYFIFVLGLIASSFIINSIQTDIVNLFKNILRQK
ncbi:hypothetical protein FBD94_20280 [Pedobacter hiemivivus]|uniref:Uncharacterized protein n=1 Tax=Pedobacter hiemivivus TaxID=2530454 RepID=A0A4U1G247_9SPHI|nr:hypothetical protein [Pedobacter hiemivivus]TKC57617.1 hypothetical protein FBD94_20280 [Pedobacter hiemivivus]